MNEPNIPPVKRPVGRPPGRPQDRRRTQFKIACNKAEFDLIMTLGQTGVPASEIVRRMAITAAKSLKTGS